MDVDGLSRLREETNSARMLLKLPPTTPSILCRPQVAEWLWTQVGGGEPAPAMSVPMTLAQGLRYGENPHQVRRVSAGGGTVVSHSRCTLQHRLTDPLSSFPSLPPPQKKAAAFYVDDSLAEFNAGGVATSVQHNGKEMSYNNYLDADAAYVACCDFKVGLGVGWVGLCCWRQWGGGAPSNEAWRHRAEAGWLAQHL